MNQEEITQSIREYWDLSDQASRIEMQMSVIRENIMDAMEKGKIDEIKTPGVGRFVIESRRAWEFSPQVKELEEKLSEAEKSIKDLKDTEKAKGIASYKENKYLKFYNEK